MNQLTQSGQCYTDEMQMNQLTWSGWKDWTGWLDLANNINKDKQRMQQFLDNQAPRAVDQQRTDAELASLIASARKRRESQFEDE